MSAFCLQTTCVLAKFGSEGVLHITQLVLDDIKQAAAVLTHQALKQLFAPKPSPKDSLAKAARGPCSGIRKLPHATSGHHGIGGL